jgi:hypothetical protein
MRARSDDGVVIPLVALLTVTLLVLAAFAVDISRLANNRQALHDTLDTAAHAGAYKLPDDPAGAQADAIAFAHANDPGSNPVVTFWCVVGSVVSGSSHVVNTAHIPHTCYPGPAPYDAAHYTGLACNRSICAIPCTTGGDHSCNTLQVSSGKDVPYAFAPVIGIDNGDTGTLTSVACKGFCGTQPSTPIDFAVVADRTGSMGGDIQPLEDAIASLLEYLTPSVHSVALGTIGQSRTGIGPDPSCYAYPTAGTPFTWTPVGLSNDYDLTDVDPPSSPPSLNSTSRLVNAVVDCLGDRNSSTGTNLGDSLRAAANLLLGLPPTSGAGPPVPGDAPRDDAQKVILFMTDGAANEPFGGDENHNCSYASDQAQYAKDHGIIVVTIAYRLQGVRCGTGPDVLATTRLANMASRVSIDIPTVDQTGCDNNPGDADVENTDGDLFFCTPSSADLRAIFQTAVENVNTSIRFIKLPG